MDGKEARKVTEALVWSTFAIWIAWDIVAVTTWGGQATESAVIGDTAEKMILLPLAFGVLCGHFFWKVPAGTKFWKYRHWVIFGAATLAVISDSIMNCMVKGAYPIEVVAMFPVIGFFLGHFFWAQRRKNP